MHLHENETIGSVLHAVAARYPERMAVIDADRRLSYAELDRLVDQAAASLLSLGIKKADHVGIWAKDDALTLTTLYALWRIGAVPVPLCTSFLRTELETCCQAADVTYLFAGIGHKGQEFAQTIGTLQIPVTVCPIDRLLDCSGHPLEAVAAAEALVAPSDPDTILFTSGTTGYAKPVVTTHYARVNTMYAQAEAFRAEPEDIFCSVLPMYHCFSLTATVLAAMSAGACVCFPADRRSQTILQTVEQERCTVLTAVPTLFSALLRRLETLDVDLSSLKKGMIGGSTYSEEFFVQISQALDFTLLSSLGQTEATAGLTSCSMDDPLPVRARTIGTFFPLVEGSIRDCRTNTPLGPDQEGEICVRGYNVMEGYYKLPDATAKVIDADGWLHTGDLGAMDENGYVRYTGRLKELIIRGGENIAPSELEYILSTDSRILQAKVIGVPDPHYTEEICACIVKEGALTEDDVRKLIAARAADFKVPKYVLFMEALPMTAVGKVDLRALRKQAAEILGC